jgi:hypothetical protein
VTHPRQEIRSAVRAALLGTTASGERVYTNRKLPHQFRELPAINIYTLEETVVDGGMNMAPRELTREMALVIEGWVAVSDEQPDDAMDALAGEIETAMHADFYFGGTAADSILDSTTLEVLDDGDRLMGMVALIYTIKYRTVVPVPPESLEDFERAGVTYNLGNQVQLDDAAQDLVEVTEVP